VEIDGLAAVNGYIDEVVDVSTEAVNETLTPGGQFSIAGHKIKAAGDDAEVGVYFISEGDSGLRMKVSGHFAENSGSKVIGVIPALTAGKWKVEIKTQYSGASNTPLKNLRVIESPFVLSTPAV
jgi:hypothetical protein